MNLEKSEAHSAGEDRLLALLKRRGPQRAADVARALGITPEAARQQLLRLDRLGLVRAESTKGRVGRPSHEWQLTAAAHARFPDTHAELTVQLLASAREEFGEAAIERMIARREAEARGSYAAALAGARTLGARVARLASVRSREGYMAEAKRVKNGWLLIENHCPICAAASACAGFCRSELELFRAVLGEGVAIERTDHLLAGARRCAYLITER